MANLETLELTINANAESASKGLSKLIDSLSSLSKKINEAFNGMSKLNSEIKKLGANGGINVGSPTVAASHRTSSGASRAARAAKSSVPSYAIPAPNPLPNGSLFMAPDGRTLPIITNADVKEVTDYAEATKEAAKETSLFERVSEKAKETMGSLSKGLGRVGRIFSTMLIRTVLKSLIKSFQNAWSAAYEFSKNMGGQFAESVDKAKTLLAGATTSIVSAFSPAITALLPVIQSVVGAIQYLCKAIQWLFSLLGMSNELFGASTDAINAYAKSSGGAGKANKEMLASFDELNVISQESGGGGGGGGGASYKNGLFSDVVSDEMAKVQLIVSESLLALGLILACTGHFGIGLGLMAIGAAGIAKTVIADWGALSTEMQGTLAKIMAIVGVSTLALGAILAFSGANIPLGIGLMLIGAANLAAVAYVNFTHGLPDDIKATITTILGIVGGALLAVGAILAFSGANIPLGIGMMIAGGISLAGAAALNWDSLSSKIKNIFEGVCLYLKNMWGYVTTAVNQAWEAVKKWWEDSGIGPAVRNIWDSVKTTFRNVFLNITSFALNAWNSIKKWWEDSGIGSAVRNIWGNVSSYFRGLWDNISEWGRSAWSSISTWWHTNVTENVKKNGIWGGVAGFFSGLWDNISTAAKGAWDVVKDWWEKTGVGQWVRGAWNDVGNFLTNSIWNPIKNTAKSAWDTVKDWWEKTGIGQWVRGAWSDVGNFLTNSIWNPIKNAAKSAWDTVKTWWESSGVGQWVRSTWTTVGNFLTNSIWNPVKNAIANAWGAVKQWWESSGLGEKVRGAWSSVVVFLRDSVWGGIKGAVNSAWNTAKQWWENTGIGEAIRKAWDGVKKVFEDIFAPIKKALDWIKELFGYNGKSVNVNVNAAVSETGASSRVVQNVVATNASNNSTGNRSWLGTVLDAGLSLLGLKAQGDIGIPKGEIFVAQEHGAELIGEINGKTSVANQQQIIEGIASGVERANNEQNMLLRQQNELLRGILEKDSSVRIGASASLGRVAKQSLEMYGSMVGG